MKLSRNIDEIIDEKSIKFTIVDIDSIVNANFRLLKSRYRLPNTVKPPTSGTPDSGHFPQPGNIFV